MNDVARGPVVEQMVANVAPGGAGFRLVPGFLGAFRVHGDAKTHGMQEVRREEDERLMDRYGSRPGPVRRRLGKSASLGFRALAYLCQGDVRYAADRVLRNLGFREAPLQTG